MPFIPVPEVAGVELIFDTPGGTAENTLYFYRVIGGSITDAELEELAEQLVEWWVTECQSLTCDEITLRDVVATDLNSSTGTSVAEPVGALGTRADNVMPQNVTLCVSFRTLSRGRSYRGRNYTVGLGEGQVALDIVNTLTVTGWVDAYSTIPSYLPTDGIEPKWLWVVVSRYTEGNPRTDGIWTAINSVQVTDDVVDSQRRRLNGRGS